MIYLSFGFFPPYVSVCFGQKIDNRSEKNCRKLPKNINNIYKFYHFISQESTDLIVLDSSLSLDDFDPLNDNAKRIPEVPRRSFPPSVPQSINNPNYVSPQIQPKGFSNPIYTFYQPGQSMNYTKPITTTTTTTSTTPSPNPTTREDDKELLRKYGLDRLNLIDNQLGEITLNDHTPNPFAFNSNRNLNRTIDPFLDNGTNGLKTNGDIQPKANNNWTTFD